MISAVTLASIATGMSAVPAVTMGRTLFDGGSSFCSRTIVRASFSYRAFGKLAGPARASKTSGWARVARTLLPRDASDSKMRMICSVVLPGQKMTSGNPLRSCR